MKNNGTYVLKLRERAKGSRAYRKYQVLGLEIAEVLRDEQHKGLYIKLCKTHQPERLLALAKDIAANKRITRKGAYFMACLSKKREKK